jgi:hypothetical protein
MFLTSRLDKSDFQVSCLKKPERTRPKKEKQISIIYHHKSSAAVKRLSFFVKETVILPIDAFAIALHAVDVALKYNYFRIGQDSQKHFFKYRSILT